MTESLREIRAWYLVTLGSTEKNEELQDVRLASDSLKAESLKAESLKAESSDLGKAEPFLLELAGI